MKKLTITVAAVCLVSMMAASGWAETKKTRIGKLTFTSGYPTEKTVQKLYDELDFQRAVQAYLWALPMASYGAMADEHIRLGCASSAVVVADRSAEQQHLVLTANQDTVYMSGVLDLSNGPMVMELPPGLLGTLNNIWQQPLCDLGGPFSPEQNRGGRFLILPPNYNGPMPDFHYHVVESDSNIAVFYLRAIPQTRDDFPKLWFGPKAPEGHEGNWIQTIPGKSYLAILRLYGPLEPWFDKTWKPGDFELVE